VKKPFLETLEMMFVELAIEALPEHREYATRARDIMSLFTNCEDDDQRNNLVALMVTLWLMTVPPGHRNDAMKLLLTKTNEGIRSITRAIHANSGGASERPN
jgi:hypothetical protein